MNASDKISTSQRKIEYITHSGMNYHDNPAHDIFYYGYELVWSRVSRDGVLEKYWTQTHNVHAGNDVWFTMMIVAMNARRTTHDRKAMRFNPNKME